VCREDCGDGEPGDVGDVVVPECAGLGDVELVGVELGVSDVELAGDVTANGSTAMAAEVPAAG
jgi:hypothetical protein